MQRNIRDRLEQDPQTEELLRLLRDKLNNSDLQSLLLEVFRSRASKISPARVLHEFRNSRFHKPSEFPQSLFNRFDGLALELLPGEWHSLDLSPVSPLGTCTSISNLSQNRMVSTIRISEVVADSTNSLALAAALLRKASLEDDAKSTRTVKCCTSHRLLRAQSFGEEKFSAHFRVFSLASAGRDTGNHDFEMEHLEEHIGFYLNLCGKLNILDLAEVHVSDFSGKFNIPLIEEMFERLKSRFRDAMLMLVPERREARNYYDPLAFRIRFRDEQGDSWDIVDGGFSDWTQILLNNRKERFLSSAIGSELLFRVFPSIPEILRQSWQKHP